MLKPTLIFLGLAVAIGAVTCARAGTDKENGTVCQGSTCNGTVETTPTGYVVNVYRGGASESNSNAGSTANSSSSATGGTGGNASVVVNNSGGAGDAGRNSRRSELRTVGIAPDIGGNNTAPCRVSVGAGGGWLGGALSIQGSVLDEGCDIWRDHENLTRAGFTGAAGARLCDKPEIAKYLSHCAPQAPQPVSATASPWNY